MLVTGASALLSTRRVARGGVVAIPRCCHQQPIRLTEYVQKKKGVLSSLPSRRVVQSIRPRGRGKRGRRSEEVGVVVDTR